MDMYVHGSDTYVPFCHILSRWVGFQMNAKVERANGVIGDTLRTCANGHKDDWDRQLPLAVFAINNLAESEHGLNSQAG